MTRNHALTPIRIISFFALGLILSLRFTPALAQAQRHREPPRAASPTPNQSPNQSPDQPLDINLATPAELKALPGMGDAYVRRVIEGRPYSAKNQLVTRGVLPQAAYERIRDHVVAHRMMRNSESR